MSLSISGSQITFSDGSTQNTAPNGSFKNRIINGAMMIDQRNAGASVTPTNGQYVTDRWKGGLTQSSKFSLQQSTTAPTGFSNSLLATSLSAYSVASGDTFIIRQAIEGFNTSDLGWGTASASTVTLSFWVRSSLTGTFGGSLGNSASDYSYPFSYTISAANTWEQKSITIAGPTAGTWIGATNGVGIHVQFSLGSGSSLSGTAGSWSANGYYSATGATSVVGTNGATFYITGVQLEKGSTATSFDYRPYGTELALCQRYYEYGGQSYNQIWNGNTTSGVQYYYGNSFKVTKRANPTVVTTHLASYGFPATSTTATDATIVGFQANRTANSSVNSGYFIDTWTASAEL